MQVARDYCFVAERLHMFDDLLIACGDDHFVNFSTKFHALDNVLNHRLAEYLRKGLVRNLVLASRAGIIAIVFI